MTRKADHINKLLITEIILTCFQGHPALRLGEPGLCHQRGTCEPWLLGPAACSTLTLEKGAPVWLPGCSAQHMNTPILAYLRTHTPPPSPRSLDSGLWWEVHWPVPGTWGAGSVCLFPGTVGLPELLPLCCQPPLFSGCQDRKERQEIRDRLIFHQTTEPGRCWLPLKPVLPLCLERKSHCSPLLRPATPTPPFPVFLASGGSL